MSYRPTTERVAVAWLKTLPALGTAVSTQVPSDTSTWASTGFVQVLTVGGTPDAYLPVAQPVVSVDFWAVSPGSNRPPWGQAEQLAEAVRAAVYDWPSFPARVVPGTGYESADVLSAGLVSEIRRIRDDRADFAHYNVDLALCWSRVSP